MATIENGQTMSTPIASAQTSPSTPAPGLTDELDLGFRSLLVVQFTTVFNDNFFRLALVLLVHQAVSAGTGDTMSALATVLFLLPYAFLSIFAGSLADRIPKRSIFIALKVLELPIVLLGLYG